MEPAIAEIIRRCGLFSGLSDDHVGQLEQVARRVRFRRGQSIFREGEPPPGIYVVGTGAVRVYKLAPNGKEHVLHFAQPGSTFAEVAAIGGFACPASAEALEETICALLPQADFRRLAERDHRFCLDMMAGMAKWVRTLIGLLEDLVLRDATARVARHLLESEEARSGARFTLPTRKRDLANHLNLTSETLSRTIRRLVECGLIQVDGPQFTVINPEQLRDVADGLAPAEFG